MEENNRDFKGVWIPREVWLDKRLSAIEKIVLIEIDSLDIGENGCFASNEYLAEFCQCSQTKVSNAISKLIEFGYLELKSFDGRQRFLQSRLTKFVRQTYSFCKADTQNLQDSNIDNNIVNNNRKRKERKKESSAVENIVLEFCQTVDISIRAEVAELLFEWIKVRKAKRAPQTERAISFNLDKLKNLAEKSNLSLVEYLKEVISRGWQAFYEITSFKKKGEQKNGESGVPEHLRGFNFGTIL